MVGFVSLQIVAKLSSFFQTLSAITAGLINLLEFSSEAFLVVVAVCGLRVPLSEGTDYSE